MKRLLFGSVLPIAALMLTACAGGTNVGSSSAPRDTSSAAKITTTNVAYDTRASEPAVAAPHGPEIESGAVVTVTDGNVRMSYPATVTITRTASGVVVSHNGITRTFSATATVTQNGSYHVYAPVTH